MRPLMLKISAFGPYAEYEEINMEELGDKGLYLITGDTGAGKTTIFDAICFALFGDASGNNREASMLRSTYAKPEVPTEVELLFLHRGKKYTVKRNPEYMRPKLSGEGHTTNKANAEFIAEDGKVLSGVSKVNKEVVELLGVTREQFSQIAMIAQGDFLKLLIADTKDRQKIFSELFHTKNYGKLQDKLKSDLSELDNTLKDLRKSVEQYISGISCDEDELLNLRVESAKKGDLVTEDVLELIDELVEKDKKENKELSDRLSLTEERLESINTELGRAEEIEKAKKKLIMIQEEFANTKVTEKELKESLDIARTNLDSNNEAINERAEIEAKLSDYESLDKILISIEDNRAECENQTKLLDEAVEKKEREAIKLDELKGELELLKNAGEKKTFLDAETDKIRNQISEIKAVENDYNTYVQREQEYSSIQNELIEKKDEYKKAKQEFDILEDRYINGQAGILAAKLEEGMPCPVCGSTKHPALAVLTEDIPTKEAVDLLKKKRDKKSDILNECLERTSAMQSVVETLKAQLIKNAEKYTGIDDFDQIYDGIKKVIEERTEYLKEISEQLREENKKLDRKNQIENELPDLETLVKGIESDIENIKHRITEITAVNQSNKERVTEISTRLKYKDLGTAKARIDELSKEINTRNQKYETADKEHRDIVEKLKAYEGQINALDNTIKSVKEIDITALNSYKELEIANKKKILDKKQIAVNRITNNSSIKENILNKSDELTIFEKKYQWMAALSNTANGRLAGKSKLMLETYIQTTYFDRIIDRANLRLLKMSGAQYELKRVVGSDNNRSQSGLELSVIDHNNGSERSVKSLSGGESFMASLSLALGLSDEVQASAGGIQIDTMFVDEGFGSLDSEKSLPLAYSALAGLTEGNKLVGIISHVSDLKEKIDKQIIVTKDKTGISNIKIQA